jgi:TonB family protein
MRRSTSFWLSLAGVIASPFAVQPAAAKDAVEELAPISPWRVDWTQNTCLLRRIFGTDNDTVLLAFERFEPGDSFDLTVTGTRLQKVMGTRDYSVAFEPGGRVKNVALEETATMSDGAPSLLAGSLTLAPLTAGDQQAQPVTPAMEAGITSVALSRRGRRIVLKSGPLAKPFAELRRCTDQLLQSWGLDVEQQRTLSRRPTPTGNVHGWLSGADYPMNALMAKEQAVITVRLMVGADGSVTGCEVLRSFAPPTFQDPTCRLLTRRARFEPALDASGKPVASHYINRIKWILDRLRVGG